MKQTTLAAYPTLTVAMNLRTVAGYQKINPAQWDSFVEKQEHGNFFQSRPYVEFYQTLRGYEPLVVGAFDDQDRLVGVVVCVINRLKFNTRLKMFARGIVMGGPVVHDHITNQDEVIDLLLKELIRLIRSRSVFLEFRNLFEVDKFRFIFEKHGLSFNEHLNFIIDTSDREQVMKRMAKTKHHQIRKSLAAGAEICIATDISEIREYYPLLVDLYTNKVKKPFPNFEFFEKFFEQREKLGLYILVKYQGKVIAGMMCPVFANRIMYDWYVCGKDRFFKDIYPSVLVTWAAIDYAMQNDIPQYDFLGAGKPKQEYGVREFKAQFGGDLKNFGRYSLIFNQSTYNLSQRILKMLGYFK